MCSFMNNYFLKSVRIPTPFETTVTTGIIHFYSLLPSCFVSDSLHASMSWVVLVLEEPKRNFEIIFLNIQINDSHWYILAFYTNFTPKLAQIFYFLILIPFYLHL